MNQRGETNLHLILTIFLGFGMLLFGVLAVIAYRDNSTTQANLKKTVSAAKEDAAADQKAMDVIANTKANELPYRAYKADEAYGGFEVQIPKSWSLVATKTTGQTQLDLMSDPDVVNHSTSAADDTHAFDLQLQARTIASINSSFESKIKKKTVTSKPVTVSGIASTWYEGAIDDHRHNGVVITIPVRDKVIVMTTTNTTYLNEFNQIVAGAKINP